MNGSLDDLFYGDNLEDVGSLPGPSPEEVESKWKKEQEARDRRQQKQQEIQQELWKYDHLLKAKTEQERDILTAPFSKHSRRILAAATAPIIVFWLGLTALFQLGAALVAETSLVSAAIWGGTFVIVMALRHLVIRRLQQTDKERQNSLHLIHKQKALIDKKRQQLHAEYPSGF